MAKALECEERVMLSRTQYINIKKEFRNLPSFILINEYIDDENITLIKSHKMLRIRNLNHKGYELTLKIKGSNGDLEINQNISKYARKNILKFSKFPKGEVKNYLNTLIDTSMLKPITKLKTIRYEKQMDDYLLVLDKNSYNGIIDYDLEVESSSIGNAKETIKKYCEQYNLDYSEKYKGKSRRAILSMRNDL